ncbi:MAG: SDR family NAD(P)-dependent oxidoreductase [Clostridiales bacterium]|nr:SDR family NAD(P)-dependent oxidoreductase [Clostridiales bacterium]
MQPVAFLVGASSGIGYEFAKICMQKGYAVMNASRTPCDIDGVTNYTVNVKNREEIEEAVRDITKRKRRIDLLVYFAGISMAAPVEHAEEEDICELYDVNYYGFLRVVSTVLPVMRAQNRGKIVAVSSLGSVLPIPFDTFYSGTKAGLNLVCETLKMELSPFRIKVYSVLLGGVKTGFSEKRNVYAGAGARLYYGKMKNAVKALTETEQKGMHAEVAAKKIMQTTYKKNPPPLIVIGGKNKFYYLCAKYLPRRWVCGLLSRKYKI